MAWIVQDHKNLFDKSVVFKILKIIVYNLFYTQWKFHNGIAMGSWWNKITAISIVSKEELQSVNFFSQHMINIFIYCL